MTDPHRTPKADLAEIQRALRALLEPNQVAELRAWGTANGSQSGYFSDFDKMARAASQLSGQGDGVYFTPNPVNPDLLARANNRVRQYVKTGESTSDGNIMRRRRLLIDFDPERLAGISATDAEHEEALRRARQCKEWLTGVGWPDLLWADSGNGAHLIAAVDLPRR